ncbi:hypothetical protein [Photobacterium sp. Alg240-V54]|uniref:hypothetical protein n=1 Tax=Photobacterium sp. Alg240-V54 TaxID=2305995 RepID=UPI0013D765DC|nr:hypothetical protein [Photobacterium sp. Alg240-V54]
MNKHQQSGMTTLLITSMLLIVALLFSLASYKNLFYQIKRTQNEVLARQAHWAAEGGLECGFANIMISKVANIGAVPNCEFLKLDQLNILDTMPFSIESKKNGKVISKSVKVPGSSDSGAIKSTSNLYFAGGVSAYPDPGKLSSANTWECTVLRYSKLFKVLGTLESKGLISSVPPYTDFPTSGQACATEYRSWGLLGNNNIPLGTKSDFIQDLDQDPFEDTFMTQRDKWLDVMYLDDFFRIGRNVPINKPLSDKSLPKSLFNENCGADIIKGLKNKEDLIWHYGGCHLNDADLDKISTETATSSGVILVIQNGIFSTKGNLDFKGMIYHFITNDIDYVPLESDWKLTDNYDLLKGLVDYEPDTVPDISINDVGYYQNGAFNPSGGYIMDAPNTYAVFRTSMSFKYNRDVLDTPLNKIKRIKWIQGSWHDF